MDPFITGGLIKAGGSLLGGLFKSSAQKKANERNRPVNQVKEWEAAGINPLFGLTSGSYIPHQANTAIGDAFGSAGGIFGETLQASKEQNLRETQIELENELLKKELDKYAKPVEPSHLARHGSGLPLPKIPTDLGSVAMDEIQDPTPIKADGSIDTQVDSGGAGAEIMARQKVVTGNGETITVAEGPDLDSLATGGAIDLVSDVRSIGETHKMRNLQREKYKTEGADKKGPLKWDKRFAAGLANKSKPDWWDRASRTRQMEWIMTNRRGIEGQRPVDAPKLRQRVFNPLYSQY